MRYKIMNRVYGMTRILPSEASKENFFKHCKKLKNGEPEWEIVQELEDVAERAKPQYTKGELLQMLADLEGETAQDVEIPVAPPSEVIQPTLGESIKATPKKKAGRPKKAVKE